MAIAALHPEQAVWEPLLLGMPDDYRKFAADTPWVLKLAIQDNESRYIEPGEVQVVRESHFDKTKPIDGRFVGGPACNLLLDEAQNKFWCSGQTRDEYVIFKFERLDVHFYRNIMSSLFADR